MLAFLAGSVSILEGIREQTGLTPMSRFWKMENVPSDPGFADPGFPEFAHGEFSRCMMPAMAPLAAKSESELAAQLQATLDVIPAYAWYALPSGTLTFVNERTADYLGLPKDHPLRFGIDTGASWDSHIALLHPDDQEESRRVWAACLRMGRAGEMSFRVRNAEGGYRWFLSRAEPLRASDGNLLYWIGVNLEIDVAKQAEDALRKSEKELREVVDTIPALIHTARPDGYIDYFNKRWL
jgi:PAS domain-containing protein